ncbi:NAD(P)-dependent oxidoreductase [Cognatishimia maritima]|nr:NAD(P)-dependent oxidoreductase [Cognatishimia maritima]
MFIKTTGRKVVVVGGAENSAQKVRLLAKTDAQIVVCASELNAELRQKMDAGRLTQHTGRVGPVEFAGAAMVFVATGCAGADVAYRDLAKQAGPLVNVVDRPELCDMTTPSIVDRTPVVVAIGTEGTAPVLARLIKTRIEGLLEPNLGRLAALAGRLRPAVDRSFAGQQRAFWSWVFTGAPMAKFRARDEGGAAQEIEASIRNRVLPETNGLHPIDVIETGAESADLLTMRAVAKLQEADVLFHEAAVGKDVLELPRRDADRIAIGDGAAQQKDAAQSILQQQSSGARVAVLVTEANDFANALANAAPTSAQVQIIVHRQGRASETVPAIQAIAE